MDTAMITQQEAEDTLYIQSEHVLHVVESFKKGNLDLYPVESHFGLRITFTNYKQAIARLSSIYNHRQEFLNDYIAKTERDLQTSLANLQGKERERKRSMGIDIPNEPDNKPEIQDFEVESSNDNEGVKRRKLILQKRRGKEDLPSITPSEKEKSKQLAISILRNSYYYPIYRFSTPFFKNIFMNLNMTH